MKNIVLIGLMGSGKTTVGKLIAKKTGREFVDTDSLIEKEAGESISEIFELYGEEYFRSLEAECILKVSQQQNCVISTGGGCVEEFKNIENLNKTGILFYLSAPAKELYERIKHDQNRPLLKTASPKSTLESLLKKREENYNLAHVKIDTVNKNSYDIVDEIIEKFSAYECKC